MRAPAQSALAFPSTTNDTLAIRDVYRRAKDLLHVARVYVDHGGDAADDAVELVERVRELVQREHARLAAAKGRAKLRFAAWPTLPLTVELGAGVGCALHTSGRTEEASALLASSLTLLHRVKQERDLRGLCEDLWQRLRWGAKPLRRYRSS